MRAAAARCGNLGCGERKAANAKSILEILALGALGGTELVIAASGDRAAEAADHLAGLVPRSAERTSASTARGRRLERLARDVRGALS